MATPKNFVDLTGQRFGRLTVIKQAPSRKERTFWLCRCDCGKEKEITAYSVVHQTRSCGCLQRERTSESSRHDLIGKRFGRLIVVDFAGHIGKNNKEIAWKCKCDCGAIKVVRASCLRNGQTRSCGCFQKENRIQNIWSKRKQYPTIDRQEAVTRFLCQRVLDASKKKKQGCSLSAANIRQLIFQPCHYCGSKGSNTFKDVDKKHKRKISDLVIKYNGLDRLDSSRGYTVDNVVPCCWNCNRAKGTLSVEEFRIWLTSAYGHFCNV